MFEDFYERYEDEEHEAIVLIENVLGAGKCNNYWSMTATTLGMVFCENAKKDFRKGRLEWPVTDEERNSEKGWNRLRKGQICRIKVRKLCEKQLPKGVKAEEILLYLEVDAQDCSSWNSAAANAAAFVSDWENKDRQMRAFAAGKLTELANEWQEDDDMFWGHAVEICGNMENGFESANIAG